MGKEKAPRKDENPAKLPEAEKDVSIASSGYIHIQRNFWSMTKKQQKKLKYLSKISSFVLLLVVSSVVTSAEHSFSQST